MNGKKIVEKLISKIYGEIDVLHGSYQVALRWKFLIVPASDGAGQMRNGELE